MNQSNYYEKGVSASKNILALIGLTGLICNIHLFVYSNEMCLKSTRIRSIGRQRLVLIIYFSYTHFVFGLNTRSTRTSNWFRRFSAALPNIKDTWLVVFPCFSILSSLWTDLSRLFIQIDSDLSNIGGFKSGLS